MSNQSNMSQRRVLESNMEVERSHSVATVGQPRHPKEYEKSFGGLCGQMH
jgi:hypothetical protein